MHRSLLLLLVLGLATAGLATGQALAQEREWTLDASEQEAYLIFGVPDSDDVGVSLWCPVNKGVVNLFVPRPTPELAKIGRRSVPLTLRVGDETATFAGKIDLNRQSATSSVEVEVPANDPLFKAMEKADRLSVKVDTQEVVFPLYNADVGTLLELCRKG